MKKVILTSVAATILTVSAGWLHAGFLVIGSGETFGTTCVPVNAPASPSDPPALTFFAMQIVQPMVAEGTVTGASGSTVDVSLTNLPAIPAGHYVVITSGVDEGVQADIAGNTASQLTVSGSLAGFAVTGESFEIRKHTTVDALLGADNRFGLGEGANMAVADTVQLILDGGAVATVWYSNNPGAMGWKNASSLAAGDEVIFPEDGIIVTRKVPGALTIYQQGAVKFGPTLVSVGEDYNLVGTLKTNASVTLDETGLFTGNPATGVVGGLNPDVADNVLRVNPDGSVTRFFYLTFAGFEGWHDSTYAPAGGEVIHPGAAIYILRKSGNGEFSWKISAE